MHMLQVELYRADPANAGPIWLLIHFGCLVELAEEEVDLLLVLFSRWDHSRAGKLGVWR